MNNLPDMGVTDIVFAELIENSVDRFRFWLLTVTKPYGEKLWRRAVIDRCLPDPDCGLEFVAVGELLP